MELAVGNPGNENLSSAAGELVEGINESGARKLGADKNPYGQMALGGQKAKRLDLFFVGELKQGDIHAYLSGKQRLQNDRLGGVARAESHLDFCQIKDGICPRRDRNTKKKKRRKDRMA